MTRGRTPRAWKDKEKTAQRAGELLLSRPFSVTELTLIFFDLFRLFSKKIVYNVENKQDPPARPGKELHHERKTR